MQYHDGTSGNIQSMPNKDPAKRKEQNQRWAEENREKVRERSRAWYAANKHRPEVQATRKKATKRWQEEHREQFLASKREASKRYYERHKEAERARSLAKRNLQIAPLLAVVTQEKAAGCLLCHERDADCLDFHHRDPALKTVSIARMIRMGKPTEAEVRAEIAKCVVLCANCHRKVHAGSLELPV
jgi:hypothetical protein